MESKEIKEKVKEGWVRANVLFEIIGKPAEHLIDTLKKLVELIEKDKKIVILSSKIHDAEKVEDKDVFSSFSELDLLFETPRGAVEFVYDYMPASIEITEPNSFNFKLNELNGIVNDIATRLHQYDATLKQTHLEKEILFNHIQGIKKALEDKGIKLVRENQKTDKKEETEDKK
ncbi:hypothetical protein J4465_02590 [Candidatus Pacearchaeota archaeon]|nr:hypothetical protein [Candidatus Pacearchaeota archaeon]